jgi:small membrane protein
MILLALITVGFMFYFLVVTHNTGLQRLFILASFSVGLLFIFWPELTSRLANLVGIGRGADLVSYLSTLFLLFVSINFYLRFRKYEEQLTIVVRELALRKPHTKRDKS